jgi:hypothetical protein
LLTRFNTLPISFRRDVTARSVFSFTSNAPITVNTLYAVYFLIGVFPWNFRKKFKPKVRNDFTVLDFTG